MHVIIIANPHSGSYDKDKLYKCAEIIKGKCGHLDVVHSERANDCGRIIDIYKPDVVIIAGGDGLINEAILPIHENNIIFSVLPFGTVNVFCREYSVSLDPITAAQYLNLENCRLIPMGFINDKAFILMCSFGYDAAVVKRVVEKKYDKNKTLAHLKEGVYELFGEHAIFEIEYDLPKDSCVDTVDTVDTEVSTIKIKEDVCHVIISLGKRYAGSYKLSDDIRYDKLNVFPIYGEGVLGIFKTFASMLVGKGFASDIKDMKLPLHLDNIYVNDVNYCQLDGEYIELSSNRNQIAIKKDALIFAL